MGRQTPNLLPQVSFSIMLALSLKPRHGYELMQQIEHDSKGLLAIGPGALYSAVKQLREDGLITELPAEAGERRRYYQLTRKGRSRLDSELEYYAHALNLGRQRRIPLNDIGTPIWAG
jgi:PadR family transcriptional regulator PadR